MAGRPRGRQPRLAVIDQATVDGRRRLVLIRRDNAGHLLIIGGPTDVVVGRTFLRAAAVAATWCPRARRPATDTLPRAVRSATTPCGRCGRPAQGRACAQARAGAQVGPRSSRNLHEAGGTASSLRSRRRRAAPADDGRGTGAVARRARDSEVPAPPAAALLPFLRPPAARERQRRALDPRPDWPRSFRACRVREPPRRGPGLPPTPPASPAAPRGSGRCARRPESFRMAQAARSRPAPPAKPGEKLAEPTPPVAPTGPGPTRSPRARARRVGESVAPPVPGERDLRSTAPAPRPGGEPVSTESEEGAPAPRFEPGLRRPFKADDLRSATAAPKPADKPADEPSTGCGRRIARRCGRQAEISTTASSRVAVCSTARRQP